VRHAPDQGCGAGDELRLCEAVRPQRIEHPHDGLTTPRGARRLVEEEEPPVVIECPADASQLVGRRSRPEDVDVDGEDLVKPRLAGIEVRQVDGFEREAS
jgi:hypothetical protein